MIILGCGLAEELKWGVPCYTRPTPARHSHSGGGSFGRDSGGGSSPSLPARAGGRAFQKSNIVLIHVFKEYCALLFFKGALLNDPHGILIQQTKNVQAARQIRFTHVREMAKMEKILKAYIYEAVEVEEAGSKVKFKKTTEFKMPEEFQKKFDKMPALKTAYKALTPGRQRAYLFYFSQPKQSKTRESRVEKCVQQILNGKGLNDR